MLIRACKKCSSNTHNLVTKQEKCIVDKVINNKKLKQIRMSFQPPYFCRIRLENRKEAFPAILIE